MMIGLAACGSRSAATDVRSSPGSTSPSVVVAPDRPVAQIDILPEGYAAVETHPGEKNFTIQYRKGTTFPSADTASVSLATVYDGTTFDMMLNTSRPGTPPRYRPITVQGNEGIFIETLPDRPGFGLQIVQWVDSASNQGVQLAVSGRVPQDDVLALANSVRIHA
jgi:hypothetical protein